MAGGDSIEPSPIFQGKSKSKDPSTVCAVMNLILVTRLTFMLWLRTDLI